MERRARVFFFAELEATTLRNHRQNWRNLRRRV